MWTKKTLDADIALFKCTQLTGQNWAKLRSYYLFIVKNTTFN